VWEKYHHKVTLKVPALERTEWSMIENTGNDTKASKISSLYTFGGLLESGGKDLFKS
jgi:hypothetical protein